MSVPFVQYLRPNGQRVDVEITRSDRIELMARAVLQRGYAFELEELRDGTISMTVENIFQRSEGPIAAEFCSNGPAVLASVDALVEAAHVAILQLHPPISSVRKLEMGSG